MQGQVESRFIIPARISVFLGIEQYFIGRQQQVLVNGEQNDATQVTPGVVSHGQTAFSVCYWKKGSGPV